MEEAAITQLTGDLMGFSMSKSQYWNDHCLVFTVAERGGNDNCSGASQQTDAVHVPEFQPSQNSNQGNENEPVKVLFPLLNEKECVLQKT